MWKRLDAKEKRFPSTFLHGNLAKILSLFKENIILNYSLFFPLSTFLKFNIESFCGNFRFSQQSVCKSKCEYHDIFDVISLALRSFFHM